MFAREFCHELACRGFSIVELAEIANLTASTGIGNRHRIAQFRSVTAYTLALSPIRDTLTEGFSHFVSSMTAPVASGWSGCRVGLAPTGRRRLCTAHTHNGLWPPAEKLRADPF